MRTHPITVSRNRSNSKQKTISFLFILWWTTADYCPSSSFSDFKTVQFSSAAPLHLTLCNPTDYSMSGSPVHHQLPEFAQTHVHRVSDAIQPSSSVIPFSSCLESFPASGSFPVSQFFASGGQSIGVSASAISPSNEYSGLMSFRIDWFDLFVVQGTLKSLLQHCSSKASILRRSAFFMVQYPYMTTGKTIAFDWTDLCQQSNVSTKRSKLGPRKSGTAIFFWIGLYH